MISSNSSIKADATVIVDKVASSKQISPSKHWCFTLNNYTKDDIQMISSNSSIKTYIFQEEVGENGTPHLQGYVEFINKCRPLEKIKNKRVHWTKTKNVNASINYCSKEDTRSGKTYTNMIRDEPLRLINKLYPWQQEIVDLIETTPDDRSIYWYWEKEGCRGKTALCKLLCANYNAICVSGKSADCKYAIVKHKEIKGYYPKIIIFDVPRCNMNYINYEAIEKIKDGIFFSSKYESGQVIMNSPHIIIFTNEEPDTLMLSSDRWRVKNL